MAHSHNSRITFPSKDDWIAVFKKIGFGELDSDKFAGKFLDAKISKNVVKSLDDYDLRTIGIEVLGERKLILQWLKKNDDGMGEKSESSGDGDINESRNSNDSNSPKKKKSKVDLFLEDIKGSRDILEIVAKASETISVLENIYKLEKKKNDEVTIPLSIRHTAVTIENECPIASFNLPHNVPFVPHKDFTDYDIYRTYQFRRILSQYNKSNLYVIDLYEALENDFKSSKNINKIEKKFVSEFETYKVHFCKSVVTAILTANKLQAHIVKVGVVKNSLSVFSPSIDRFMVIFYNALLVDP